MCVDCLVRRSTARLDDRIKVSSGMGFGLCGSWFLLGRLRGRREVVRGGFARADVMQDGAWPRKGGRKCVGASVECCGARGLGMLRDDVAERSALTSQVMMKMMLLLVPVATVLTMSAASGASPVCHFEGTYKSQDGNTQSIAFNGMFFIDSQSTGPTPSYFCDADAVIHDEGGTTGTFEDNCNVIHWSDGGTWLRLSSKSSA